jgi:hypothetical protein
MGNLLESCQRRASRDNRAARGLMRTILPHHQTTGALRRGIRIHHFALTPERCSDYLRFRNDVCRIPIFIFEVRRNKVSSTNRTTQLLRFER